MISVARIIVGCARSASANAAAPSIREYDEKLRPFIDEVQANAEKMAAQLVPRTEEAIRARNAKRGEEL